MNTSFTINDCSVLAESVTIPNVDGFAIDLTQACNSHFYKSVKYVIDNSNGTNSSDQTTAFISVDCYDDDYASRLKGAPCLILFCLTLIRFFVMN